MQYSLLDALQKIADETGSNLNAVVHDVLTEYVNEYFKEDKTKWTKKKPTRPPK